MILFLAMKSWGFGTRIFEFDDEKKKEECSKSLDWNFGLDLNYIIIYEIIFPHQKVINESRDLFFHDM